MVAVQRLDRRGLGDRRGVGRALRLDLRHAADQRLRAAGEADAPAGHRVGLGDAVHRQRALVQRRLDLGHGGERETVVDDLLVDVVGHRPDVRVAEEDLGERAQLVRRIGGTRRVRRRIEDQPLGPRADGRIERLRRDLEALLGGAVDEHGRAAGDLHHVRIGHPVGARNDDLVAVVDGGQHGVEQHLLAADADDDLVGAVVEAVVAPELVAHRLLELGRAVHLGVLRVAGANGGDGRVLHRLRRVEVRFAGAEADDVVAGRLELGGARGHGHRRRRLDAAEALGKKTHRAILPVADGGARLRRAAAAFKRARGCANGAQGHPCRRARGSIRLAVPAARDGTGATHESSANHGHRRRAGALAGRRRGGVDAGDRARPGPAGAPAGRRAREPRGRARGARRARVQVGVPARRVAAAHARREDDLRLVPPRRRREPDRVLRRAVGQARQPRRHQPRDLADRGQPLQPDQRAEHRRRPPQRSVRARGQLRLGGGLHAVRDHQRVRRRNSRPIW